MTRAQVNKAVAHSIALFAAAYPMQRERLDETVLHVWSEYLALAEYEPAWITEAATMWLAEHDDWMPTLPQFETCIGRVKRAKGPRKPWLGPFGELGEIERKREPAKVDFAELRKQMTTESEGK